MAIEVLAPEVISKIAAGEVIERTASVVKELIMTWLQTNGQWLGAIGTLVLAIATFVIVRQNRKLLEHNRLLVEKSPIKELIISVINPIKEFASRQKIYLETKDFFVYEEEKNRNEARKYLKTDKDAELLQIEADAFLFPKAFSYLFKLSKRVNQTLYEDFKRRFNPLASKIDAYNSQGFKELLLELLKAILSQNFRNKVKEVAETSDTAYKAIQPCNGSWAERKLEVFCAYLVFNKLLVCETNFQRFSFRHYVGTIENEQMLEEFWRENSKALMAIIYADEAIMRKASQVLQESDRLGFELEEIENQLSKEKNRLRLKYNFTDEEIQTLPEEQLYSEYAEQHILA